MLTIKYEGRAIQSALAKTLATLDKPEPMLKRIGMDLADSTMKRFATGKGPDGAPWAANSPTTLSRYSAGFSRKKNGSLTKRSMAKLAGKKPLIGESSDLSTSIEWQLQGRTIMVGSRLQYAAVQQFGAKAGSLWRGTGNARAPWGDIPARPYLGLSAKDERNIMEIVRDYLL